MTLGGEALVYCRYERTISIVLEAAKNVNTYVQITHSSLEGYYWRNRHLGCFLIFCECQADIVMKGIMSLPVWFESGPIRSTASYKKLYGYIRH